VHSTEHESGTDNVDPLPEAKHRSHLLRNVLIVILIPFLLFIAPILVWLSYYVNPIDVVLANEHILAEYELENGDVVSLIQFWNRVDFYTTKLKRIDSEGNLYEQDLDGDDAKIWHATITLDPNGYVLNVDTNRPPAYWIDTSLWRVGLAHVGEYDSPDPWNGLSKVKSSK